MQAIAGTSNVVHNPPELAADEPETETLLNSYN